MNAIIVSDLHIGSGHFKFSPFERFIKELPADHELIMNGDIIDSPYAKMASSDRRILDLIKEISYRRKVVWIRGNHENGFTPPSFGNTIFKSSHSIDRRLLITHGDDFDDIMPRSRLFIKAFKFMHNLRVRLGAKPVHVAEYAKKWKFFYRVLRKNVALNAVNSAVEQGFDAVACGHTHYPEDFVLNGVRYINTGAWTEFPAYYLCINADGLMLNQVAPLYESQCVFNSSHQYGPAIPYSDSIIPPADYNSLKNPKSQAPNYKQISNHNIQ